MTFRFFTIQGLTPFFHFLKVWELHSLLFYLDFIDIIIYSQFQY